MIKFMLRNNTVKELPDNLAEAVMRVLRKDGQKFSKNDNIVNIRTKAAMHIVLAF